MHLLEKKLERNYELMWKMSILDKRPKIEEKMCLAVHLINAVQFLKQLTLAWDVRNMFIKIFLK